MPLVAGKFLDTERFFRSGRPIVQGSSCDLTIGSIFDDNGKKVEGPFTLKPGHMVQVVSAEVFSLAENITGHVTYKTTLTKRGIWALTVGIVDPGWNGPIATSLLNFSRVDHAVAEGDPFLRVSFFEHDPVQADKLRRAPPLDEYLRDIRKTAASMFPATFLDTEKIAEDAGKKVLTQVRTEALGWVAGIALLFTVLQLAIAFVSNHITRAERSTSALSQREVDLMHTKVDALQSRLLRLEQSNSPADPRVPAAGPSQPPPK